MKRFLIPAVMLALFAPIGFTGCGEKAEETPAVSPAPVETPAGDVAKPAEEKPE